MMYQALTYLPYSPDRHGEMIRRGPLVRVVFDVGDFKAFRPHELIHTVCVDDKIDRDYLDLDLDMVGKDLELRPSDLIEVQPMNGRLLGALELVRIRTKAWFYRKVTGALVWINQHWLPEGSPDHRYYFWYVKNNRSVERVAQAGGFRCDNWRSIDNEQDLDEFYRDLVRLGYWSAS